MKYFDSDIRMRKEDYKILEAQVRTLHPRVRLLKYSGDKKRLTGLINGEREVLAIRVYTDEYVIQWEIKGDYVLSFHLK